MIIEEQPTKIVKTITGETEQFRIATNSKAFRVLVDGIYADKVSSIVRELMSNAYDAHARVGRLSVPFEVRLPNALNSVFSIRDYGCSMEHDFVMRSYSTLFESSKSATNDEVGAFGLGAKSFLSYTDACTLTCWLAGEQRSYAVAIGDSGVPEVSLVYRGPSDEHDGVEVQFATNPSDFSAFSKAAGLYAYGFDTLPKFLGAEVVPETPILTGNGWRWFSRRLSHESDILVRQGCAVYPTNRWRMSMSRYGITNEGTLIVDRPIGTVNVTASRESLALTASQESDLDSAIRAAIEDLNLKVRETYHSLGSEIERARFAYANTSLLGRGDWPTSVQTPWPMLKFDQGALVPYDRFHVATMEKVVIVWDDGTRIPRRTLRLRALARSGKSVYVEIDRSKVSAVRQLLQLESRQIIKIDSIPDVHINRTASSAGRVKKTVEQGSVWVPCNRNRVSAGPLGWVRGKENFGHMIGGGRTLGMANVVWVESVIAEASAGKPLLYLTSVEIERALAKGKINPDLRLDLVLCRRLNDESLLQTVRDLMLHQAMGSHVRSDSVRTVMLERLGAPIIAPSQPLMPFYRSLLPEVISGYEREVNSQIADLAERFPLLFRFDTQAALDYIAMCDASAAELAASQ